MSKKNNLKKPVVDKKTDEDFLEEESNKKSIIIIIIAIIAVIGLILCSVFLFNTEEEPNGDGEEVDIKLPLEEEEEPAPEEKGKTSVVKKVTSETVAEATKYKVIYLDKDANQIGEEQTVLKLEDRVEEEYPIIRGYRFNKWIEVYDEEEKVYYFVASYRKNVERIPAEEEKYLTEDKTEVEGSYDVEVTEVDIANAIDPSLGETPLTSPTYNVEITGSVEELEPEDIEDELSIDENEYAHIIALRFNAPENITKDQIEKMQISVRPTDPADSLESGQVHYNGEDTTKTGRELLDSTDEEYENNEFYFYYYQEVDTAKKTTVEVYWGNDEEAREATTTDPAILPRDEYIEVYNIDATDAVLDEETEILE